MEFEGHGEVEFGVGQRGQEKQVALEKQVTLEKQVAWERQEYCQEQGELGCPAERQESLEGEHPKCQESLLVVQVLNDKSCIGWDFGKGAQRPEHRECHSTFPFCSIKDPVAKWHYTLETYIQIVFLCSPNYTKARHCCSRTEISPFLIL